MDEECRRISCVSANSRRVGGLWVASARSSLQTNTPQPKVFLFYQYSTIYTTAVEHAVQYGKLGIEHITSDMNLPTRPKPTFDHTILSSDHTNQIIVKSSQTNIQTTFHICTILNASFDAKITVGSPLHFCFLLCPSFCQNVFLKCWICRQAAAIYCSDI